MCWRRKPLTRSRRRRLQTWAVARLTIPAKRSACAGRIFVKHLARILSGSLLAAASLQAMACYTVYDRSNRVMYQSDQAPVDMSLPIHETIPARFPGGHLVFDGSTACQDVVASRQAPVPGGTPLITDQQMAKAMRVPYTAMAGGLALVRPEAATMRPGLTIVPTTSLAATPRSLDPTRMMGAGPAPRR